MTALVRSTGVTREDMGPLETEEPRRPTGRPATEALYFPLGRATSQ